MKTTALVLATLLVALGAVALAPSASACEITEAGCIPDFLADRDCIENLPPRGQDLCWGP